VTIVTSSAPTKSWSTAGRAGVLPSDRRCPSRRAAGHELVARVTAVTSHPTDSGMPSCLPLVTRSLPTGLRTGGGRTPAIGSAGGTTVLERPGCDDGLVGLVGSPGSKDQVEVAGGGTSSCRWHRVRRGAVLRRRAWGLGRRFARGSARRPRCGCDRRARTPLVPAAVPAPPGEPGPALKPLAPGDPTARIGNYREIAGGDEPDAIGGAPADGRPPADVAELEYAMNARGGTWVPRSSRRITERRGHVPWTVRLSAIGR
jgi:hypothetical protein